MHINPQQPSYLLDCLHQGKTPNGGLAFPKVWPALRLDYSPASLQRISRLLQQIHSQQAARYDILQQSPTGRNFLLTLASYLTDYLHHHTGAPPMGSRRPRLVRQLRLRPARTHQTPPRRHRRPARSRF